MRTCTIDGYFLYAGLQSYKLTYSPNLYYCNKLQYFLGRTNKFSVLTHRAPSLQKYCSVINYSCYYLVHIWEVLIQCAWRIRLSVMQYLWYGKKLVSFKKMLICEYGVRRFLPNGVNFCHPYTVTSQQCSWSTECS